MGPNGAGKSNFLDALNFVRDGLVHSLDFAIRQRGGFHKLWHYPRLVGNHLAIALHLTLRTGISASYSFRIRVAEMGPVGWRWEIVEEECRVGPDFFHLKNGQIHSSMGSRPVPSLDRLFLVLASGQSTFREVFDALSDMQFYHLLPGSIPDIDTYDAQSRLRSDGSNLASVLAVMRHADPDARSRVEGFLRVVLPTLVRTSVEPVIPEHAHDGSSQSAADPNDYRIALVFHQKLANIAAALGPKQMSEGTLRTLAILTALYQTDALGKRRPTLTAIEDVEAAVHPAELAVLFDALEEASLTTQVIVTCQSPDLLDHKDIGADSILAVSAEDGVTRIGPPDAACRVALDKQHLTAGELLRIGQLAPQQSAPLPAPMPNPAQ